MEVTVKRGKGRPTKSEQVRIQETRASFLIKELLPDIVKDLFTIGQDSTVDPSVRVSALTALLNYTGKEGGGEDVLLPGVLGLSTTLKTNPKTWVYLQKLESEERVVYKFGISSKPEQRLKQQSRKSVFTHKLLSAVGPFSYSEARKIEKEIAGAISEIPLSQNDLPDGWTETFSEKDLPQVNKIFNKYL